MTTTSTVIAVETMIELRYQMPILVFVNDVDVGRRR